MARRVIQFELHDESERALTALTRDGRAVEDVIRDALVAAAGATKGRSRAPDAAQDEAEDPVPPMQGLA